MAGTAPPNILCICTAQQRYDALGCYGNPHLDTLVATEDRSQSREASWSMIAG